MRGAATSFLLVAGTVGLALGLLWRLPGWWAAGSALALLAGAVVHERPVWKRNKTASDDLNGGGRAPLPTLRRNPRRKP